MMVHELELGVPDEDDGDLWKQGLVTMLSFWFFGAIPVAAFALADAVGAAKETRFIVDCCVTLLTLGLLGAFKAKISGTPVVSSALKMIINGGLACGASYMIAWALAEAMGGSDVLCLGATCEPPVDDSYRFNNAPWVDYGAASIEKPSVPDQFWDCSSRSGVDGVKLLLLLLSAAGSRWRACSVCAKLLLGLNARCLLLQRPAQTATSFTHG